jgi:hypothetical protein
LADGGKEDTKTESPQKAKPEKHKNIVKHKDMSKKKTAKTIKKRRKQPTETEEEVME